MIDRRQIMVVGPVPPPMHGAAQVTRSMAQAMREAGIHVHLHSTSVAHSRRVGYLVLRVVRHGQAVLAIVRQRRATSHVYVGGAGGRGLWFQSLLVLAARTVNVPVVFHHHSYAYLRRTAPAMRTIVWVGGAQLRHIVLCPEMGVALQATYRPAGPIVVCSNAVMLPPAALSPSSAERLPAPSSGLTLGHLSNLTIAKGLITIMDAFRACLAEGQDVRLLLAGPAAGVTERSVLSRAEEEFGERFEWVGQLASDDVADFMSRLDLFLFPSQYRHEAQPLVVLEAARVGVPSLVFEVGCLGSMIQAREELVAEDSDFSERLVGLVSSWAARGESRGALRSRVRRAFAVGYEEAHMSRQALLATLKGEQT